MRAITSVLSFACLVTLAPAACGDDAATSDDTQTATDSAASDTATDEDSVVPTDATTDTTVEDSAAVDTSVADTSVADTSVADTSVADTSVADTSVADSGSGDTGVADTGLADTSAGTCGCGSASVCLQAKTAEACASLSATCTGGQARVDACATDAVMASCERSNTVQYLYYARIEDWIADLATSCASTLTGAAGTLTVAEIPAGVGEVCSCQRTVAACVQGYGAVCDTLTCDAEGGVQASECASASRIPGRCVTQDGQRELVFYTPGANLDNAESSCLGASSTAYYWFPAL